MPEGKNLHRKRKWSITKDYKSADENEKKRDSHIYTHSKIIDAYKYFVLYFIFGERQSTDFSFFLS